MILFDPKCRHAHVFEAWFASSAAYVDQQAAGQLLCPLCGDTDIVKAAMAPNVAVKGNARSAPTVDAVRKQATANMAAMQAKALAQSEWVGADFAVRARAMHAGEETQRGIYGQASVGEAKALLDEGVPLLPLPLQVVPPKSTH